VKKFLLCLSVVVMLATSCAHQKKVTPVVYPTMDQLEKCCEDAPVGCDTNMIPPFATAGPYLQIVHVKQCINKEYIFVLWVGERTPANDAMERFFVLRVMEMMNIDAEVVGSKSELIRQELPSGPIELQMTIFELKPVPQETE
jgi:hypothetical protein